MSIRLATRVSWSVLANLLSIYPLSLGTVCTPPAMSCNVKTNNSNHHLHPPLLQELWFLIRKFLEFPFLSAVRTTWKAKRFNRFFKVPFWQMEVLGYGGLEWWAIFLRSKIGFYRNVLNQNFQWWRWWFLLQHTTLCLARSVSQFVVFFIYFNIISIRITAYLT